MTLVIFFSTNSEVGHFLQSLERLHFVRQMQQRNSAVVDMEGKLNDMKSKSEEYSDKVLQLWILFFLLVYLIIL